MNTPLVHPRDLVGATRDHDAVAPAPPRPVLDGRPVHLSAEEDDPWRRLPCWIDIPLRPLTSEHPAGSFVAVASLLLFVVALVML
jgi:hypothetical protein